jgi:hypothetical protein
MVSLSRFRDTAGGHSSGALHAEAMQTVKNDLTNIVLSVV